MSLYRELDLDEVAYQQASCLQSHIPGQAKVFAVDLRPGLEADGLGRTRHGHLSPSGQFGLQYHFARDSSNGQVSDHLGVIMALWLDTGAFERNEGIVLDIQEVGGLQVGVATFHARIQGRGVDLHFHRGARRVSLVKNDGAVDVLEVALHRRKHHVFAGELNQGMIGVELPAAAGGGRAFAVCCHVLSSLGERELFRSLLIDVTVAHLVLQNYVADYIYIPCFSTIVKVPNTYLSM